MHGGLRGVMAQAACRCGTLVVLDDAIGLILSFELVGFLFVLCFGYVAIISRANFLEK